MLYIFYIDVLKISNLSRLYNLLYTFMEHLLLNKSIYVSKSLNLIVLSFHYPLVQRNYYNNHFKNFVLVAAIRNLRYDACELNIKL